MAKKAKRDINFIIKCPHCLECEFKLDDVNQEDQVKFYTDTPFKNIKNQTSESECKSQVSSTQKDNMTDKKLLDPSSIQKSSEVVSPSFQIHLTDISYHNGIRNSLSYNLQPVLMNQNNLQNLNNNIPEGDLDQPNYESPYPIKEENLNEFQSEPQIEQEFSSREEIKLDDHNNDQQSNYSNNHQQSNKQVKIVRKGRKLSVKSIPLFKNEMYTFMDTLMLGNSISNQQLKGQITEPTKVIKHQQNLEEKRRQINHLYFRKSIACNEDEESKIKIKSSNSAEKIKVNSSLKSYKVNFKEYDERTQLRNFGQYLRQKQLRKSSISNHSNKSEEKKSSIKHNINHINHFSRENLSPDNLYIRHINTNLTAYKPNINRSRIIPVKEFINQHQRSVQSDPQPNNAYIQSNNNLQRSEAKRNSLLMRASQQILTPQKNFQIDDLRLQLRERPYVNQIEDNSGREQIQYKL